jgi:hypothetical protein
MYVCELGRFVTGSRLGMSKRICRRLTILVLGEKKSIPSLLMFIEKLSSSNNLSSEESVPLENTLFKDGYKLNLSNQYKFKKHDLNLQETPTLKYSLISILL